MTSALKTLTPTATEPQRIDFDFNSASPFTLFNLLADDTIDKVEVSITEAFDDPAATLELGTVANSSLIFSTSEIDPGQVADYVNDQNNVITLAEILRLLITPGTSTQGKGFVLLTIRR